MNSLVPSRRAVSSLPVTSAHVLVPAGGATTSLPPAVVTLVAAPPSSIRRILGMAMVAVLCLGISALFWGRYDVVAVAPEKAVPKTKEKIISPMELGFVQSIRVEDGQASQSR